MVNKPDSHGGGLDWTKICEKSSKVITFIDLAGHEKYLKTTVFGMTGHLPDFCMLMVRGCVFVCVLLAYFMQNMVAKIINLTMLSEAEMIQLIWMFLVDTHFITTNMCHRLTSYV